MKCPDCNGTGKIELLTSTKACGACEGSGTMPDGMTFRSECVCLHIGSGNVDASAPFGNACDSQHPTASLSGNFFQNCDRQVSATIIINSQTLTALQEIRNVFSLNELEAFRLKWMGLDGYFRAARDAAKTEAEKQCILEGFKAVRDCYFVKHDQLCSAERAKRECTFYGENDIFPV